MGLDMNLVARKYIGPDLEKKYKVHFDAIDIPGRGSMKLSELGFDVVYWRKCNAIHAFFVSNCQKGEDDCLPHYVNQELLKELVVICKQIIKNHKKAEELLPVTTGFFFGSQEYDEYYFDDLKRTVKVLDEVLKTPGIDMFDFYYQSSW